MTSSALVKTICSDFIVTRHQQIVMTGETGNGANPEIKNLTSLEYKKYSNVCFGN